jgi:hypothetical protein
MKKYNQHYVPRSILRNFINTKNVFCLMKDQDGKIINSPVENLCAEKSFYCFSLDIEDEYTGKTLDYDKQVFDEIDGLISPIVKKIVGQGSVEILDENDRRNLAKYVTYQYMRSPAVKNIAISLTTNERDAKQIQGLNLLDKNFINRFSDILYKLRLKLIKSNEDVKYIISDSPVLWSPTAEGIYFPISPDYCLCYQKEDTDTLDSICINEIEFLASVRFNISQTDNTLNNIWQNIYQRDIDRFCGTDIPSYWKCILSKKDSSHCIEEFKDNIFEDFKGLIN